MDHVLLVEKLKTIGASSQVVKWFGLPHTLKVGIESHLLKTASRLNKRFLLGYHEEASLGLFFFHYTLTTFPTVLIEHCQVLMYADDTVIYFSVNSCQNIEYQLNADNNNYLTLNTSKLTFALSGGDRRLQTCQGIKLAIDHENLESEDSIKYLGVVIQKNLTWNDHIESLIAKVNQRIGLLNRIKHLLPLEA